jgi:DNA polymerase III epsilon subunit-like protein
MSNIMVDLETMGNGSTAAIVAIGAVKFSAKGLGLEEFYEVIDLNSSVQAGLTIDPDTLMWWMKQSDEARKALTGKNVPLFKALKEFSRFVGNSGEAKIWGNGASFDNPILANAYRAVNLEQPWRFWNDRCYRTVKSLLGNGIPMERVGDHHNALDDAKSQALHLIKILTLVNASKAA